MTCLCPCHYPPRDVLARLLRRLLGLHVHCCGRCFPLHHKEARDMPYAVLRDADRLLDRLVRGGP
jgi:Zn-finger protein